MYYEVTTPSGSSSIIQADTNRQAKGILCKQRGIRPSDPWFGVRSMEAQKLRVDFPETVYNRDNTSKFERKDVLIFDEHHGTAVRIKQATVESIQYFLDEYSTLIFL